MEINKLVALFNKNLKEILNSSEHNTLLKYIGKFYNYSFINSTLIHAQKPHAVKVADQNTWKKLGREVKNEESCEIWVLTPKISNMYVVKETGKYLKRNEMTKEEQKIALSKGLLERKKIRKGYVSIPVYDISQTEGKELKSFTTKITGTPSEIEQISKAVHLASGVVVTKQREIQNIAYFVPETNTVVLKESEGTEVLNALLRESSISLLKRIQEDGSVYNGVYGGWKSDQTKILITSEEEKKVVSQCCAYSIANHIGNETNGIDIDCLNNWILKNKHTEAGIKRIEIILNAIGTIVTKLITALEKELGLDSLYIDESQQDVLKEVLADQLLCVIEANAARVIVNGGSL